MVTGTVVVDGITLTADQVRRAAEDLAQGPDVLVRLRPQLARKLEVLMGWNVSLPEAIRRFVESGPGPVNMDTNFGRSALTTQEMDTVRAAVQKGILANLKQETLAKALQSSQQTAKGCDKSYVGGPSNPVSMAPPPTTPYPTGGGACNARSMPGTPTPAAVLNGYKAQSW